MIRRVSSRPRLVSDAEQDFQNATVEVADGGLLGSSRAGLTADEPAEAHMTVAVACVTVGFGEPPGDSSGEAAEEESQPLSGTPLDEKPPPPYRPWVE